MEKGWIVEEIHGVWWAYRGVRPADDEFISHYPDANRIRGPYFDRKWAEERVRQNFKKI